MNTSVIPIGVRQGNEKRLVQKGTMWTLMQIQIWKHWMHTYEARQWEKRRSRSMDRFNHSPHIAIPNLTIPIRNWPITTASRRNKTV